MGGHGGLNILPQKSWNVYNARNRAIVAADEAQAAIDAQNERVAEAAELARQNLQAMRARAAAEGGDHVGHQHAAPLEEHVNLFADFEAAERNAERDAARKREDARLTAKLMPDLDLSKSAREPAPWYVRAPPASSMDEPDAAALGSACSAALLGESSSSGGHDERKRKHHHDDGGSEREHHKHHKHHKHDKHDKHDTRDKHDKHDKYRHEHRRRERGSPSPEANRSRPSTSDADALAQLRHERMARERRELMRSQEVQRPGTALASTWSSQGAGEAEPDGALRAKWLALTGQGAVTLKPKPPRPGRR